MKNWCFHKRIEKSVISVTAKPSPKTVNTKSLFFHLFSFCSLFCVFNKQENKMAKKIFTKLGHNQHNVWNCGKRFVPAFVVHIMTIFIKTHVTISWSFTGEARKK